MNRRVFLVAVSPVLAVGLAVLPAATASAASADLTASASGANEVGGAGDASATASGTFTVDSGTGQFCYTVTASGLTDAAAMHIHKGAAGANGPVVIPLDQTKIDAGKTCATAAGSLLTDIAANPADYYLNVHTKALPAGAIRGQLSVAPASVGAGSGGLLPDNNDTPVLPVLLLLTGGALVGAAGWRLARRTSR